MPASGLLVRAARQHGIDLAGSWMVGDTLDAVEAGRRAGCRSILFGRGGLVSRRSPLRTPDRVCPDWDGVLHAVLGRGDAAGFRAAAAPLAMLSLDCAVP